MTDITAPKHDYHIVAAEKIQITVDATISYPYTTYTFTAGGYNLIASTYNLTASANTKTTTYSYSYRIKAPKHDYHIVAPAR